MIKRFGVQIEQFKKFPSLEGGREREGEGERETEKQREKERESNVKI